MKKAISTPNAPAAIGPYSQAIEVNGMIYTSGVIPVNPATGEIPATVEEQADQAFLNMSNLLKLIKLHDILIGILKKKEQKKTIKMTIKQLT